MVKIGSARIDENGNASGGTAGDQTGIEVSTQTWYLHPKGWRVFRARSPIAAEKIARCMASACANSFIGYDQSQNQSLYYAVKPLGYDCSKVRTPCETDCARLVRICVLYAGIDISDFYTATEGFALLATGQFVELVDHKYTNSSDYLRRGDILVTRTKGHTVVVLSDGDKVERGGDNYMFTVDDVKFGSKGNHVLLCQEILRARGFVGEDGKELALDKKCEANTVFAINAYQTARRKAGKELGTDGKNDGICGQKMWADLIAL